MDNLFNIAFVAGLISFFSPCIIPMISVYFTLITGLSVDELNNIGDHRRLRRLVFVRTILFVLAFTMVFTLAGGAAGEIGRFFNDNMGILNFIGGTFIIILGFKVIGVFRLEWLERINLQKYLKFTGIKGGNRYLTAFLVGFFFAIACSHCIGPTLYSVLIAAGATGSSSNGMLVMFLFSVGLAIPYLVVALFIQRALGILGRLTKYKEFFARIMGLLLILFGFLMVINKFYLLTQFFSKLLPYKLPLGM